MKVAILGAAGSMGSALAKSLAKAGNEIYAYGPHSEKVAELAQKLQKEMPSARIVVTRDAAEAARNADVIIPAVWYDKQGEVASSIRDAAKGKIVVNIANPLNPTFDDVVTPPDTSAAEQFAKRLPESKVVKAFNTAFAADYENPQFAGVPADILIAGDDEKATEAIAQLVKDAGFNPLYVGKLAASRTLERMTVLLIALSQRYGYNWLAGWKVLHK